MEVKARGRGAEESRKEERTHHAVPRQHSQTTHLPTRNVLEGWLIVIIGEGVKAHFSPAYPMVLISSMLWSYERIYKFLWNL